MISETAEKFLATFMKRAITKYLGLDREEQSHRELALYGKPDQIFCPNEVRTSRYNILSFIPVNMLTQFMKPANIYFLMISILQVIPSISLSGSIPTVALPLTIVVIANMIKDGVEDYNRHVSDEKENSQKVQVIDKVSGKLVKKKWKKVQVGEVVVIENYNQCPADIVLLASSDPTGVTFVQTANLDGETNLKLKSVPKELNPFCLNGLDSAEEAAQKLLENMRSGSIICQLPNNALYQFEGSMSLHDTGDIETSSGPLPIGAQNVVLRGCKLRNTEWVLGAVVYTGPDTKIQMNSTQVPRKVSSLERLTGKFTLISFWIQIILCVAGSVVWAIIASQKTFQDKLYLNLNSLTVSEIIGKAVLKFFSYTILFSNFIPISLPVTMGIVKILQSRLIEVDESMKRATVVRSSDLNEELGQVEYVFTDKTGTLTRNKMEFRKACINGVSYGEGLTEIKRNVLRKLGQPVPPEPTRNKDDKDTPNVNFIDHRLAGVLTSRSPHVDYEKVVMFFFSLAANHSVMIEAGKTASATPVFSASSPDEGALTYGAKHFGFEFLARDPRGVIVSVPDGRRIFVEQLAAFDFTSSRKRSSLLCRCVDPRSVDGKTTRTFLMIKGADSVMIPRLTESCRAKPETKQMLEEMEQYALDGLRTLCIGVREIADDQVKNWLRRFKEASTTLLEREEKLENLASELECEVELVGISAIEDKLQDNVGDVIDGLRGAGIKVWMLTGDKLETAVNIGLATSLISYTGMYKVVIDMETLKSQREQVISYLERTRDEFAQIASANTKGLPDAAQGASESAIIIDGGALDVVLKSKQLRNVFAEMARLSASVICCRVSPEQKGSVVRLIKGDQENVTLAIGDGANDCNMIQSANIGVGLRGEEGLQAFNSSDYGINEFQALKPLLLVHGRWAYRRIAKTVLYMFYKNVVIVMPAYLLNIMTALFSGQRVYEEFMYQLFNVIFTALPIIAFGVLEQDLCKKDCLRFPQLYRIGPDRGHASKRVFAEWMLTGFWHSCLIFFIPYYSMTGKNIVNIDGVPSDHWLFGMTVYLCIIIVVSMKLVFETYYLNGLFVASVISSVGLWFASLKIMEEIPTFSSSGAGSAGVNLSPLLSGLSVRLYSSPMTLFIVLAASAAALTRDFIFKAYRFKFRFRDYHMVMANMEKKRRESSHTITAEAGAEIRALRTATLEDVTVFTENDPASETFLRKTRRARSENNSPRPLNFSLATVNPEPLTPGRSMSSSVMSSK